MQVEAKSGEALAVSNNAADEPGADDAAEHGSSADAADLGKLLAAAAADFSWRASRGDTELRGALQRQLHARCVAAVAAIAPEPPAAAAAAAAAARRALQALPCAVELGTQLDAHPLRRQLDAHLRAACDGDAALWAKCEAAPLNPTLTLTLALSLSLSLSLGLSLSPEP